MASLLEFLGSPDAASVLQVSLKLLLSGLIGALVGYERESHGQTAGLRTNILVCLAACLIMMLSLHMAEMFSHLTDDSVVRVDPGRIASYAMAGMGFLGAGAIIKGRGSVRGLTTAAGLWIVTALGLAVGAGLFVPALATAFIALVIMYNLRFLKPDIRHDSRSLLTVKCCCEDRPLKYIKSVLLQQKDLQIEFINYRENREERIVTYTFRLLAKDDLRWGDVVGRLLRIESLLEISWVEADVP
jgi:putative Mg2+ transporter-C (MgtC) family protein